MYFSIRQWSQYLIDQKLTFNKICQLFKIETNLTYRIAKGFY